MEGTLDHRIQAQIENYERLNRPEICYSCSDAQPYHGGLCARCFTNPHD